MILFIVIGFMVGVVIAVPLWFIAQHLGVGRGFHPPRRIDRHDAVPCEIVAVALRGRLVPGVREPGREEAQ
ncbi:hypothetical protein LIG30_3524 [Burkholderia sp. lig30]|jgi:hypothetical protein|uniref:hypothetical protein n=1 Tax=Burkholderia sp. lig30 TaxID=1192124 RepID=UPI000460B252|nr:hypothetical protein [Burkholderia sp. lig30]KDB07278.1 hypothetical protein LIG30_3524 [Burkholderia sp. lig30]